jgi:hypothetical protein
MKNTVPRKVAKQENSKNTKIQFYTEEWAHHKDIKSRRWKKARKTE